MKIAFPSLVLCLILSVVSCGDKDKSKSSKNFTSQISTVNGYFNLNNQSAPIEVGNNSYPVQDQMSAQLVNQAMSQAQYQNIQPINVNGVMKFRARYTGSLSNPNQNYPGSYQNNYQQNPYLPGGQQSVLQLTSIQFY